MTYECELSSKTNLVSLQPDFFLSVDGSVPRDRQIVSRPASPHRINLAPHAIVNMFNANTKPPCPVHVSLCASDRSIVHGCPGVPRSIPRIETTVELRPSNGVPFTIRLVGLELRTVQKVSVPLTIGSNDTFREYKVWEEPIVYSPPLGEFAQKLLAVDIPVLIPVPRDIVSSGQFPNWNASTVHKLLVKVSVGESATTEVTYVDAFPVVIKVYDLLPLYRQFNEPVFESRTSDDNQIIIDLSLPVSSVGPKDQFVVFAKVMTNTLNYRINRKLKLKQLTLQIKEILECHEGGLPTHKENKIFTTTKNFEDQLLNSLGISHQFILDFPVENDYLQLYSVNSNTIPNASVESDTAYFNKNKALDKIIEGVPITHTQGFSTSGRLFSLRYEAIVKVKLVKGRDMEIHLPFTVSAYDRVSSDYLLKWIMKECLVARERFGKDVVNRIVNSPYDMACDIFRKLQRPPVVYRYTKADWVRLGFNADAFGMNDMNKALVDYID